MRRATLPLHHAMLTVGCLLLFVVGCSKTGSSDADAVDPLCESLCETAPPKLDDAFKVCSAASVEACRTTCDDLVRDYIPICGSCRLEGASFSTGETVDESCDADGLCTIRNGAGCQYPNGDSAQRDACYRTLFPREEVECEPQFRPLSDCADLCS
ncbi:MAG: hypothetical protein KC609_01445 [Myxococcales bacterium]|nr:hypothetical protein [Myxococcales bacterium]